MSDDTALNGPDPILVRDALKTFDALWSPRIVTRVNDDDVRVAEVLGEHTGMCTRTPMNSSSWWREHWTSDCARRAANGPSR